MSTTQFEEDIRRGIVIERLQAAVTQWVSVSNEEVEDEHRRRNEKVRVNVVAFRGDDYRDEIEVTDADIEEFYENESLVYQVPEKRKLRFLLIDQAALADAITPTEAEIQEYYDFNASRYMTPGQVRASQILLRIGDEDEAAVEARAAELTAQARTAPISRSSSDRTRTTKRPSSRAVTLGRLDADGWYLRSRAQHSLWAWMRSPIRSRARWATT